LKTLEAVSRRSLLSLDVRYFILADVRGGLLAVYLASIHRWDPVRIGAAMGVQILDGVGAGIFGVAEVLIIADLTRGTGRFNLMQGAVATATGLGGALSNVVTGIVVQPAGFDAGFLTLAAIAAAAFAFFALAMPESQRSSADPGAREMAASTGVTLDNQ
jgi:MFS family permease